MVASSASLKKTVLETSKTGVMATHHNPRRNDRYNRRFSYGDPSAAAPPPSNDRADAAPTVAHAIPSTATAATPPPAHLRE